MKQDQHIFTGVIYKMTFPNNKVYIGQTIDFNRRMNRYKILDCKSQKKLYNALKKYNWTDIQCEIICQCDNINELNEKETELIKEYNSRDSNYGYNISAGGSIGADEAWRKKQSKIQTGLKRKYVFTEDHRRKIGEANKRRDPAIYESAAKKCSKTLTGRKTCGHSEETKQKIGNANKGQKRTPEQIEANRLAQIKYHQENEMDDTIKQKISKGNKGKKRNAEQRKRYSEAAKKRWKKIKS